MQNQILTRINSFVLIMLFGIYWSITIMYCMPENYIKIKMSPILNIFGNIFPQQWSFFAPPPNYNTNLFYSYYTKDHKLINSYEVLNELIKNKQLKAPFNSNEQLIDYTLNSTIYNLNNLIIQQKNLVQIINKDSSEIFCTNKARDEIRVFELELIEIQTLLNYSKIVLNKNMSNLKVKYVIITITGNQIPKFENRKSIIKPYNSSEGIIYKTDFLSL